MTKRLGQGIAVSLVMVAGLLAHEWGGVALIDHGVAGALLAGGGGHGSVLAAASFVVLRLVGTGLLAMVPVLVVARLTRAPDDPDLR